MSTSETESFLAPIHQDQLMEAMGAGFLLPSQDDVREGRHVAALLRLYQESVPDSAREGARGGRRHGAVCLLLLKVPAGVPSRLDDGSQGLAFPVPVSWVASANFDDSRALAEVRARAATFPDVVDESIPLTHAPHDTHAPGAPMTRDPKGPDGVGKELELNLGGARVAGEAGEAVRPSALGALDESGIALLHRVDKIGGAFVGLLWGRFWECPLPQADLVDYPSTLASSGSTGASLLSAMATVLLGDDKYASDRALLNSAARRLERCGPSDGIDPPAFLLECVAECLASEELEEVPRRDVEEFKDGASGVLASRIALRPEALGDAMHIGSRALLVFLMNPTQVGLERFLQRRPSTGHTVGLLAKTLVGLYTGLAAMPKELKGSTPPMLGRLAELALGFQRGEVPVVAVSREMDARGAWRVSVKVHGDELLEVEAPGDPRIARVLRAMASLGASPRYDPLASVVVVTGGPLCGEREVQLRLKETRVRLPERSCLELTCTVDRMPPALRTKEGLAATLRNTGSGLVSVSLGQAGSPGVTCSALIEEEALDTESVAEAVRELLARVAELAPAPSGKSGRSGTRRAAPRRRKPHSPDAPPAE